MKGDYKDPDVQSMNMNNDVDKVRVKICPPKFMTYTNIYPITHDATFNASYELTRPNNNACCDYIYMWRLP